MNFLLIIFLIFIIALISLSLLRSIYFDNVNNKIFTLNKKIENLNKQHDILMAQKTKYSSPNRFIEIGIESGLIEPHDENDILYLKIESDN